VSLGRLVEVELVSFMATTDVQILNWNIHGLNAPIKRDVVRNMVSSTKATIACIQETKIQQFDDHLVSETLGQKFKANFSFLPASRTSGGILITVSKDHFKLVASSRTHFTLTARIQMLNDGRSGASLAYTGPNPKQRRTTSLMN
jgi:exonuclease III